MPRAVKRCGDPSCDEPMPCPKHTRPAWGGSTRRVTLPADWETRSAKVLERDPVCTLQLYGCTQASTQADHISDRNDHRLEMLRGVCDSCHGKRSSAQGHAARRRRPTSFRGS